jgi:transcriptional regulator with XRE-family HTH domain
LRSLILDARKGAGLSQAAVADKLGRPQSYVADIERNERRIDVIEFLALAEAIGFDPVEALKQVQAEPQ